MTPGQEKGERRWPEEKSYDSAVAEKARRIALVRCGLLKGEPTDEEIWTHWKALSKVRPTCAFEVVRSLNILATCDGLADAGVPESALAPIRHHAFPAQLSSIPRGDEES